MKINDFKTVGFQPFSITIETQEEANYLYALVSNTKAVLDDQFGIGRSAIDLANYLENRVDYASVPELEINLA